MVEVEERGRAQWLESRSSFIGSSDAPAILGCGYAGENAHTVWARKVGIADELDDNDRLLCGRLLQDGICNIMRHKTGYDIRPAAEFEVYRSKEYPWIGATPDSLIYGDPRGIGVGELKNVDHALMREWKGSQPPLKFAVQHQHQLLAIGATWGLIGAVVGGNQPVWFEMTLHARLLDAMLPALRKFWGYVESRTPPPIDGSEGCSEALKAMYPQDNGLTVPLPHEAGRWFDELSALKASEKWIKERKSAIENRVKSALGDAQTGTLPDGRRFTWKSQTNRYPAREAYETSFRVLRQAGASADFIEQKVFTECTAKLLAMGATLYHESESGSRYFELAGGLRVRVADHAPNEKTAAWIGRNEVAEIRVDSDAWKDQLLAITGNNESEGE